MKKQRSALSAVTHGAYIDYTPEDRAKIGRYAAEKGPARATRHFACLEQPGEGTSLSKPSFCDAIGVWDSKSAKHEWPVKNGVGRFHLAEHTIVTQRTTEAPLSLSHKQDACGGGTLAR